MIYYLKLVLSLIPALAKLSSATKSQAVQGTRRTNRSLCLRGNGRLEVAVALITAITVLGCTQFCYRHDFHYHGDASTLTLVQHKTFENQVVLLDGHRYVACLFRNVTLEYDGTGPYGLEDNHFEGPLNLSSKNKSIGAAIYLLEGLGIATTPMFDTETGQRIPVESPRFLPRS